MYWLACKIWISLKAESNALFKCWLFWGTYSWFSQRQLRKIPVGLLTIFSQRNYVLQVTFVICLQVWHSSHLPLPADISLSRRLFFWALSFHDYSISVIFYGIELESGNSCSFAQYLKTHLILFFLFPISLLLRDIHVSLCLQISSVAYHSLWHTIKHQRFLVNSLKNPSHSLFQ